MRFASLQSYYTLFSEAGISWKKTQKCNPRKNPDLVSQKAVRVPLLIFNQQGNAHQDKTEIEAWLEAHREEIESGKLKVFF